jgi:hypothetical protein
MRRIGSLVVAASLAGALCAPRAMSGSDVDRRVKTARLRSEAQKLIRESLDGRPLVVRVYPNPRSDPEGSTKVSIRFEDDTVQFCDLEPALPSVSESCVVLFWAPDQTDEVVATLLARLVYAHRYSEASRLSLSTLVASRPHLKTSWTILDAGGQPIPQATVEVLVDPGNLMGQIPIQKATTDEHGRIERWLPAGMATFALTIAHPNYGIARAMYMHASEEPSGIYVVPLVPLDSDAAARGIQGTVTDAEGRPVPGAEIDCIGLHRPDGNRLSPHQRFLSYVLTDDEGWFSMCQSFLTEEFELQGPPPAGTRYQIHVRPPKWANLRQFGYDTPSLFMAGTRNTIVLTPMEAEKVFHTFSFEDRSGPITDPEALRDIVLSLYRDGREWVRLTYDQYEDGYALPPGTLRATARRGAFEFRFAPIDLTADSPEHLIVKVAEPIVYRGRVIGTQTKAPVPDALVVSGHPYGGQDPCALTDEQWAELYADAAEQAATEALDILMRPYRRVAMTDANGLFELTFVPGQAPALSTLMALAPGYRPDTKSTFYSEPDRDGITEVPTFELRAAGPVHFPTFVFEDENGPVTDPNKLEAVTLAIRRTDNMSSAGPLNDFIQRREFVPGRYFAEAVWERRHYIFEPLDLTEPASEAVVFKPREIRIADAVYQGQIVDGITGRPVPGALVIPSRFKHFQDTSSLTPAQWAAIRSLGRHPDLDDPALAPLLTLSDFPEPTFARVALTDEKGWFDMILSQAEMSGHDLLIIHAEGFVLVTQLLQFFGSDGRNGKRFPGFETHVPDEYGVVTLPPIRVYPAGTVRLTPVLPDPGIEIRKQRIRLSWRVTGVDNPPWVQGLYRASGDSRGPRTVDTHELRPNINRTVYVPAGVDLRLSMHQIATRDPWPPVDLGSVRLRQGEMLDLGRVEFDPGIEIAARVVDTDGRPVPRMSVRCAEETGSLLLVRQPTDDEGMVNLRVRTHSRGKLAVFYYDRETRTPFEEATPYEVAGAEDAGKVFKLQISDKMIQLAQRPQRPG